MLRGRGRLGPGTCARGRSHAAVKGDKEHVSCPAHATSALSASHAAARRLPHRCLGRCGCGAGATPKRTALATTAARRHDVWNLDPVLVVTLAAFGANRLMAAEATERVCPKLGAMAQLMPRNPASRHPIGRCCQGPSALIRKRARARVARFRGCSHAYVHCLQGLASRRVALPNRSPHMKLCANGTDDGRRPTTEKLRADDDRPTTMGDRCWGIVWGAQLPGGCVEGRPMGLERWG